MAREEESIQEIIREKKGISGKERTTTKTVDPIRIIKLKIIVTLFLLFFLPLFIYINKVHMSEVYNELGQYLIPHTSSLTIVFNVYDNPPYDQMNGIPPSGIKMVKADEILEPEDIEVIIRLLTEAKEIGYLILESGLSGVHYEDLWDEYIEKKVKAYGFAIENMSLFHLENNGLPEELILNKNNIRECFVVYTVLFLILTIINLIISWIKVLKSNKIKQVDKFP